MRVVIAEDSVLFREGLAALLTSAGHEVVGRAQEARHALDLVGRHRPDIAVLDVRMPPSYTDEGAWAAVEIRARWPDQPVMLLSQHVETGRSVSLVSQGGFGYLLKDRVLDVDDFVAALERVTGGGTALDPEVVGRLVATARATSDLEALTPREIEVLELMAQGRANRAIAERLWLTERTVETHIANILRKMRLTEVMDGHRRVLAVLSFLEAREGQIGRSEAGSAARLLE